VKVILLTEENKDSSSGGNMTGKDINAKRVFALNPGVVICNKVRIARSRLIDIERDCVITSGDDLARLGSAFEQIISSRQKLRKLPKDAGLTLRKVSLRPAVRPQGEYLRFLGVAGQLQYAYEEAPWLHGRRFDNRKKVNVHQVQLLVEGAGYEVRSPTEYLGCLKRKTR
jgi:hypothetical protein